MREWMGQTKRAEWAKPNKRANDSTLFELRNTGFSIFREREHSTNIAGTLNPNYFTSLRNFVPDAVLDVGTHEFGLCAREERVVQSEMLRMRTRKRIKDS